MNKRVLSILLICLLFFLTSYQSISAHEGRMDLSFIKYDLNYDDMIKRMEKLDKISPPVLDQAQEEINYGFWFDDEMVRWQEFIPTLDNLQDVEVRIAKTGSPGNMIVQIRDGSGLTIIDQRTILESSIPSTGSSWISVDFAQIPYLGLVPGNTYRIYVLSSMDSTSPDDRYSWRGFTTSTYCLKCDTDVSSGKPDFDYSFRTYGFGVRRITKADFNGNRSTDISVYRPSNGNWYIKDQSPVSWGLPGDLPMPGDYDGEGTIDIAIYRPSNSKWYVKDQGNTSWGFTGDIPVQADYSGDGVTDIAVLRPSNGKWYIQGLGNFSWYQSGDIPVPCDYNGDFADEIAVYRPSNGKWYVKGQLPVSWGFSGDIPVPGDYDGDGSCDIAVYRPSNGRWYVQGQGSTSWGVSGDIPVPGDYDGCGDTEIAVLRPSNGRWYIQGMGNFSWYQTGDYPLPVRDTNADGDPYE